MKKVKYRTEDHGGHCFRRAAEGDKQDDAGPPL